MSRQPAIHLDAGPSAALPIAARRHDAVAAVHRQLIGSCGVPAGSRIAVAVSGGPDSVALLVACAVRARRRRDGDAIPEPAVVHVHHHLRGSADGDAELVARLCAQLGVELEIEHVRPPARPGGLGRNAREMRYEALARAARRLGAPAIATGHHADDQLETVLMAICRGGGVDAFGGMPWRRDVDEAGDPVALVRPMLALRKADALSLCAAAGVAWREDPSNADRSRPRGRLRRDVIPALESLWPRAVQRAGDAAAAARAASELQAGAIAAVFGDPLMRRWERDALRALPVPSIALGLRRAIVAAIGPRPELPPLRPMTVGAEAIADATRRPRCFALGPDWTLEVRAHTVELSISCRKSTGVPSCRATSSSSVTAGRMPSCSRTP